MTNDIWISGWQTTSALNTQRAGAAILHVGNTIYAIGGVDGVDFMDSVEFSKINPGGSVSDWKVTSSMGTERGFFDAVYHNGYIYAVGGGNGPSGENLLRSVERAQVLADGTLGPWILEQAKLNYPRRCVKLITTGNKIIALGGFGGVLLDTVEEATINKDGSVNQWRILPQKMTIPRYVNTAKKLDNTIFVLGGHRETEGSGLNAIESSRIDTNNVLGDWKQVNPMKQARYALSSATANNYLYAAGGLNGAIYLDSIEKTRINGQGELSEWQTTTSLASPRANFGTVTYKGHIYIIGGTNRDGYYASVEYASINDKGDIGFWGTKQQAAAYESHQASLKRTKHRQLPNRGVVTQVIHTNMYSYVEVKQTNRILWIAAPKSEFAINDKIRFSRGVTMTNFHSRTLDRDFPTIIFVEHVQKE
ncbi:MAG: Kelch repeat-containing protein, partial [Gammaproteobacteria bacterium]